MSHKINTPIEALSSAIINGVGNTIATSALTVRNSTPEDLFVVRDNGTIEFKNFSFPTTDGTISQSLVTDGLGNLTWGNPSSNEWARDVINGYVYTRTATDRVGIGTSAPARKLEISNATATFIRATWTTASSNGGFELFESATKRGGFGAIGSTYADAWRREHVDFQHWGLTGDLNFFVGAGSANEKIPLRIKNNGDIAVGYNTYGAATPTARLHIKSSGDTSTTYALKIDSFSGVPLISVRDDGYLVGNSGGGLFKLSLGGFGQTIGEFGGYMQLQSGINQNASISGHNALTLFARASGSTTGININGTLITFNSSYSFPIVDGTASQAIITDGLGNLTFGAPSSAEWARDVPGTYLYPRTAGDSVLIPVGSKLYFRATNSPWIQSDALGDSLQFGIVGNTLMNLYTGVGASQGNLSVGRSSTYATARIHARGADSTSANYSLKLEDSALANLLSVRNDGRIDFKSMYGAPVNANTEGWNWYVNNQYGYGIVVAGGANGNIRLTADTSEWIVTSKVLNLSENALVREGIIFGNLAANPTNRIDIKVDDYRIGFYQPTNIHIQASNMDNFSGFNTAGTLFLKGGDGFAGQNHTGGNVEIRGGIPTGTGVVGSVKIQGLTYPTTDGTSSQAIITDGLGNLSFGAPSSAEWARDLINGYIYPRTLTDKVGIGTIVPTAMLEIKGAGNTSATYAQKIENSSSINLLSIRDNGQIENGSAISINNNFILTLYNSSGNTSNTTGVLRLNATGTQDERHIECIGGGGIVRFYTNNRGAMYVSGYANIGNLQLTTNIDVTPHAMCPVGATMNFQVAYNSTFRNIATLNHLLGSDAKIRFANSVFTTYISPNAAIYDVEIERESVNILKVSNGAGGLGSISVAGIKSAIQTVSANTALTSANYTTLVDASAGIITITLPLVTNAGLVLNIKKIDASANSVVVQTAGADTIDGAANKTILAQWTSMTVQSDGTNWYII